MFLLNKINIKTKGLILVFTILFGFIINIGLNVFIFNRADNKYHDMEYALKTEKSLDALMASSLFLNSSETKKTLSKSIIDMKINVGDVEKFDKKTYLKIKNNFDNFINFASSLVNKKIAVKENDKGLKLLEELKSKIIPLLKTTRFNVSKLNSDYKEFFIQSRYMLIGGSLLGLLFFMFFTSVMVKSITNSVDALSGIAIDLANGSGDLTKRIIINSKDEISYLAQNLNKFISKIHETVKIAKESSIDNEKISKKLSTDTITMDKRSLEELSFV